jgi:hypothetical protein
MNTARALVLAAVVLLTLFARDASPADTCGVAKKLTCIRGCPTVASCTAKPGSVCPTGDCSEKAIRKGCRKVVGRCRTRCRTPCLRSCDGKTAACVAATDPACAPSDDDLYPLTCGAAWKDCAAETAAGCRKVACCPTVHLTEASCPEKPCSCVDVPGRMWTYAASGTASGGVGATLVLSAGVEWQLDCGGWTFDTSDSLAQCKRSTAEQPIEISWTATGPGRDGCYCADAPWTQSLTVYTYDGETLTDAINRLITCP